MIRQLPQIANRFNKEEIENALAMLGKIDYYKNLYKDLKNKGM
mgnify:CR=1 FL=1